jgi:hypothetical protein
LELNQLVIRRLESVRVGQSVSERVPPHACSVASVLSGRSAGSEENSTAAGRVRRACWRWEASLFVGFD